MRFLGEVPPAAVEQPPAADPIAAAAPVRGERALGWLVHYVVGIAFAEALGIFSFLIALLLMFAV